MIFKYYCGARHIGSAVARGDNAPIQRYTIEEAIADAKEQIRTQGVECVVVVEIVAVVRKDYPPVTVEILK